MNLIVTCEHAGNQVPDRYKSIFANLDEVLVSHRGWDPGALELAHCIATHFNAPLFFCETTRLLIEPNRSLNSFQLYSEYSKILFETDHDFLLKHYYFPHRGGIEELISKLSKPVLHLSVHTFTPILNGAVREVDVGLLFDPERRSEVDVCEKLFQTLNSNLPLLQVKLNEPYKGTDDGFTTFLRTKFRDTEYMGIEIEVNQKYIDTPLWKSITSVLQKSLSDLLIEKN